MSEPIDRLLQSTADAIAARDASYMEAYTHWCRAVHAANEALITLSRWPLLRNRAKAEQHYLATTEEWLRARLRLDEAQIERIAGVAMYAQIVRLVFEEAIDQLPGIKARLDALEAESKQGSQP